MNQTPQPPICFGRSWEAEHVECRGGDDPSYLNPRTGNNRRDTCQWYSTCAQRTNANRTQQAQQPRPPAPGQVWQNVVPPTNMVRPPAPPPPQAPTALATQQPQAVAPAPPVAPARRKTKRRVAEVDEEEDTYEIEEDENGVHYAPPEHATMPTMVPLNTVMMGTATSSTLTIPEPHYDREGRRVPMGTFLGRTIFRSLMKFGGLAIANAYDYYTIGESPRRRRRR